MRAAFVETLTALAAKDRRVMLLTGDLGFMVVEKFAERFPDRFVNVGVAEQDLVGIATGLAEAGYLPFCYSIATFASMRAYEFFRDGPILQRLPVRIAGVGGGFEYGHGGPTHYGLEDVGVMRVQPGLTLVAPADPAQAGNALLATWNLPGPVYYRLGKNDRHVVPGLDGRFELGRAQRVRDGDDAVLLAMGSIAQETVAAAELLADDGVNASVLVVASLTPAPVDDLREALASVPVAVAVEAHYVVGGMGSLVCEVVAEAGIACRVVRHGVRDVPDGRTGGEAWMNRRHRLSARDIADAALAALRESAE